MFGQAGRPAGIGGLGRRGALLRAGRHLGDGVPPDAADPGAGGGVVLHHGGQHGDVVALGSHHRVLVRRHVPGLGGRGAQQTRFWEEGGVRGRRRGRERRRLAGVIPKTQEEQCKLEDPSLEYSP